LRTYHGDGVEGDYPDSAELRLAPWHSPLALCEVKVIDPDPLDIACKDTSATKREGDGSTVPGEPAQDVA
jgi:hypothetical protein